MDGIVKLIYIIMFKTKSLHHAQIWLNTLIRLNTLLR